MVQYFYEWGVFIGGIAAFISLLFGGFLYLTSAGDPGRVSEAKDRMTSALIGLVLLLSIYLILNTINPELTVLTAPIVNSPDSALSAPCDTNADCSVNYECKDDPTPGDGIQDGTCFLLFNISPSSCERAILYTDTNYQTVNVEITPASGCIDLANTTINSVKIIGGCILNLYSNTGCPEPPIIPLAGPLQIPDLGGSAYGITQALSVGVGGGGGSCVPIDCGPCERFDMPSCSCVPSSCGCLIGESLILTLNGFEKIEDLKEGDYVIGYEGGRRAASKILEKSTHFGEFELYSYKGYWFSGNHLVYTDDYKDFKPVSQLSDIKKDYKGTVYNIQTETKNYFGENNLLIHNK